jgi:CRP-like cAMP-binding protein
MESQTLEIFQLLENVIFLKKAQLFSGVSTADLRAVAQIAQELRFEKNDVIVREDDVGESMYIIKSGRVAITKQKDRTASIELAVMGEGECFGDMAVIDTEVRSATVRAQQDCVLLKINRDDLLEVLSDFPRIAIELLRTFVKRLRTANYKIQELSNE